jgi:hypothetical protein
MLLEMAKFAFKSTCASIISEAVLRTAFPNSALAKTKRYTPKEITTRLGASVVCTVTIYGGTKNIEHAHRRYKEHKELKAETKAEDKAEDKTKHQDK